jgi:quercetin dioxygenase-like cupin family protein
MNRQLSRVFSFALAVAFVVSLSAASLGQAVFLSPGDLQWKPASAQWPAGTKIAVLSGNPAMSGEFTIRLMVPANGKLPPHTHSADEHVTVLSGTAGIALGSKWDSSKLHLLGPGGFWVIPANTPHYFWAKTDVEIEIHAMGPRTMHIIK